jgi:hypothetical protein
MPARIASAPELATLDAPSIQPTSATNITPDLPPLAQRIADLTRRADAGDMVASCMLGMELQQCAERRRIRGWLRLVELGPRVITAATQAENVAATRATLARLERHCAGVPDERIAEAPRRIIDAADRGNGAAAGLAVVRSQEWVSARLATEPELVARFRDGYPRWIDGALQAQDQEAARAILIQAMYGSPMDLGFRALMRDGVALRALDLALVRVARETGEYYGELPGLRLAQSETTLDADAKARADALGQRWYEAMMRFPEDDPETDADTAPDGISWAAPERSPVAAMHARCQRG